MPLPSPAVDTRTYADLVAEAEAVLPRIAPQWTDYNAHDPGITLLELLAWITEADLYRFGRVSHASERAVLRWYGVVPRPPMVAETVLAMSLDAGAVATTVPAGTPIATSDGAVTFTTSDPLSVVPAKLGVVYTSDRSVITACPMDNPVGTTFLPLGLLPARDSAALYLGFDAPLAGTVQLFVDTGQRAADYVTRGRLEAEGGHSWKTHPSATLVWEYAVAAPELWRAVGSIDDATRALTLSGLVHGLVEAPHVPGGLPDGSDTAHYFLRCRLQKGSYDYAPRIERVLMNAVRARHEQDATPAGAESLGSSDGRAGQTFRCSAAPVLAGSTQLSVASAPPTQLWVEAASWDRIGPHDRAFVLVPETGDVLFGDGRSGRVPEAGAQVTLRYRVGGGAAGNLPAGSLAQRLLGTAVQIAQPLDAIGGSGAETLADAEARAMAVATELRRAITLGDFEALALSTPGVLVARARAVADTHPDFRGLPALGSVTVIVVPRSDQPAPRPTHGFLRAVRRYLGRRRTLTTELHVIAPTYTQVTVRAQLFTQPNTDTASIQGLAVTAVNAWFDATRGGPDGTGWPIGRTVYRAEVLALLANLTGVDYVEGVSLLVGDAQAATCTNASICADGLVEPGPHRITVTDPTTGTVTAPPYTTVAVVARLYVSLNADRAGIRNLAVANVNGWLASGADGRGWPLGGPVRRADVEARLRATPGVVHIEDFSLVVGDAQTTVYGDATIPAGGLVAPGLHRLTLTERSPS